MSKIRKKGQSKNEYIAIFSLLFSALFLVFIFFGPPIGIKLPKISSFLKKEKPSPEALGETPPASSEVGQESSDSPVESAENAPDSIENAEEPVDSTAKTMESSNEADSQPADSE